MSRHSWYRCAAPLALAVSLFAPAIAAAQGVPQPHVPVSTTLGDIAAFRSWFALSKFAPAGTAPTGQMDMSAAA